MPDVSSTAPALVRLWIALDVHTFSIEAAALPPAGGAPELHRIETTPTAIRRFIDRLGGPEGLAVCSAGGPARNSAIRYALSPSGARCRLRS